MGEMTPELEAFFKEAGQEKDASSSLKKTRELEMEMWKTWKDSNEDPTQLQPLLDSYRPVLRKKVNTYAGMVPIPKPAIEAEFKNHIVRAFRTYDPTKGAQLYTHVHNQLKRGNRFVVKYQNVGTIPEQRAYSKITQFNTAVDELKEQQGSDPSAQDLADHLGWNVKEVERMDAERRMGIPTSGFRNADGDPYDPSYLMPSREMEIIQLLPASLDQDSKKVFEYTFGLGGKPQLRPGEIAKEMGVSPSTVSRLRNKIEKKIGEYYGGID